MRQTNGEIRATNGARETTRRRRHTARAAMAVVAAVCLVAAVAPAGAADRAPDKLLRAYPLEQRPTTVADAPRSRTAAARSGSSSPPRLSQGTTLVIAAAVMLLAGLVVVRRGTHRAPVSFAMAAATPAVEPPPPPVDDPPARAPRPAALPAAAAKGGVVCQVQWRHEGDTSWLAAITVQGGERHVVAESPDFAWAGPQPPSRGPEAQEALQVLIDDLCEAGWTPIRGRGRESGAPRWYARRFHAATEPDTDTEET
jgi:hypothetical protein